MSGRSRSTQRKRIIEAKTFNDRMAWARDGEHGPETPLEKLVDHARMYREVVADEEFFRSRDSELPTRAKLDLEKEFCSLLLPALLSDEPNIFYQLIEAMARARKKWGGKLKRKQDSLRMALTLMFPGPNITRSLDINSGVVTPIDDHHPKSMREIKVRLKEWGVEWTDESQIYRGMRELGISVPGGK